MYVATGRYIGTGSSRSITGLSFQPKIVIIKGGSNEAVYRQDTMSSDATKPMATSSAFFTGGITSLDATGFSLGTNAAVNTSGTYYRWIAIGDDGSSDIVTGTYTGDGTDNRNISISTVTTINVLFICSNAAEYAFFRTSNMSGDNSQNWSNNQVLNNVIQSLSSGQFQVGNRAAPSSVNTNAVVYHYLAWTSDAGAVEIATYTGDGLDNRNITGLFTVQPDAVITKRQNSSNPAVMRWSTHVGDTASFIDASADAANLIQSILSDGIQVGTNAAVNSSTAPFNVFGFKGEQHDVLFAVPPTATLVITSFAPTVALSKRVVPPTATLVLTTFAPTVTATATDEETTWVNAWPNAWVDAWRESWIAEMA